MLALIFAMLAVATALETSGAVDLIVRGFSPYIAGFSPFFIVWSIYLLTSFLSELINHAVAVVLTPVAIGLAISLGQDFESTLRVLPALDLAVIAVVTTTVLSAAGALPAAGLVAIQDPVRVLQDA